ncbi:DMT family transporter [Halobium salinum]|uniref:DMT family transporter n=1 Tax=Halobium salinum TaxID=1364940 RepID=UPI00226D9CDE|nr:DMT family transporter [Halobium salinum]
MTAPVGPSRSSSRRCSLGVTNFAFLKVALDALPPTVVNALRFTVSAAVLGALYVTRPETGGLTAPLRAAPKRLVTLGLLGSFVYPAAFIVGVDATTAGDAALIAASAPIWTAVFGRLAGIDRLGTRGWVGLAVALAGTLVVAVVGAGGVGGDSSATGSLVGNAPVLLAAVVWGAYTVFSRPVLDSVSSLALTLFGLLAALPALHLLALPAYGDVAWTTVPASAWGALLLGEPVGPVQVGGAALVLCGVLLVRSSKPEPVVAGLGGGAGLAGAASNVGVGEEGNTDEDAGE